MSFTFFTHSTLPPTQGSASARVRRDQGGAADRDTTCASFLQTYITSLLAMQREGADPSRPIPLVIMTSEDTHEKTVVLLQTGPSRARGRARARAHSSPSGALHSNPTSPHPHRHLHPYAIPGRPARGERLLRDASRAALLRHAIQRTRHQHNAGRSLRQRRPVHTAAGRMAMVTCTRSFTPRCFQEWQRTVASSHLLQGYKRALLQGHPAALGVSIRRNLAMNSLTVPITRAGPRNLQVAMASRW